MADIEEMDRLFNELRAKLRHLPDFDEVNKKIGWIRLNVNRNWNDLKQSKSAAKGFLEELDTWHKYFGDDPEAADRMVKKLERQVGRQNRQPYKSGRRPKAGIRH
jgi:hypothetical protein